MPLNRKIEPPPVYEAIRFLSRSKGEGTKLYATGLKNMNRKVGKNTKATGKAEIIQIAESETNLYTVKDEIFDSPVA